MISAKDLCSAFRQAYDEHWGYIWGEAGDMWTRAAQDASTREATVEYGSRWIGRRVAVGGLIEIDDYEVGTLDCFTPLAMEQAYAELMLTLQNWCEEALLKLTE